MQQSSDDHIQSNEPQTVNDERASILLRRGSDFPDDLESRVDSFHKEVEPASPLLIVTHDYPDPDCISSAYGISHLLSFWGHANSVISFGGFVGRAENRAMIRFLNIRTVPYMLLELKDFSGVIFIDCFPGRNNVSMSDSIKVKAVFDHHRNENIGNFPFFCDIQTKLGATATIITEYLAAAKCPISPKLATGLFYGIMTDTGNLGRDVSVEDIECCKILFEIMDHRLLSQIEHPGRDKEFFKVLYRAAQSMLIFDSVGYINLGNVKAPDHIGEMVDIFHELEKIELTLCTGIFKKNLFFSIRSKTRDDAGWLAEKVAKTMNGDGGGHGKTGAGRIPLPLDGEGDSVTEFISLFKNAFNISNVQGVSMI